MKCPLWLLMFMAICATAQEQQTYIVGVEDITYYPHYNYEDNQYTGFARGILDAFAEDTGIQLIYRPFPIRRLFQELVAQRIDLKYPDNAYWAADLKQGTNITYSDPVVEYIDGVMVLPQRLTQELSELKVLGIPAGFTAWPYLELIQAGQVRIHENNRFSGLLEQTLRGWVDGAFMNISVAAYQLEIEMSRPRALLFNENLPHIRGHYRLSSPRHPNLIARFNAWMASETAQIEQLKDAYRVRLDEHLNLAGQP